MQFTNPQRLACCGADSSALQMLPSLFVAAQHASVVLHDVTAGSSMCCHVQDAADIASCVVCRPARQDQGDEGRTAGAVLLL